MLDFFIQNAWAQNGSPQGGGFMSLLPLILIFVVFYFFLIRPQMKQAKEHKQMVEALSKGDEVVTGGGLVGKITFIGENFIHLEISTNVEVKLQKHSVTTVLPKGTIKSL